MSEILTPEVEVMDLEVSISTALVKANITDQVLAELKERYGKVRLKSLDDKESYLDCKSASKEIRKIEIAAEKICEHGRSDAIKIQRLWLLKQKELLAKTAETKVPIDADIKRFEDEVERKELAEKKRLEGIFINRQIALSKMGASYDNGSYVLNHISYEIELIKQADDDMWNDTIYPKYKKVYEENQASLVEEENIRKLQLEAEKKQREAFELQQAEFRIQQQMFAQQQTELKKQMDDAEREKRLAQERIEAEERIKKGQLIDVRLNQLRGLGLDFNHIYAAYTFEDINVDVATEVNLLTDDEWNALIEKISPVISERKKVAEQRKIEEQEKQKQLAIQKGIEEARVRQEQENQRQREELAKAGDKAKWQHLIGQFNAIEIPAMSSGIYRNKISILKEKLEEVNNL